MATTAHSLSSTSDSRRPTWHDTFMETARIWAKRSKDPNTKLGCVIAGPKHEVLSVGYNGFPRGANDSLPERYERPLKYLHTEHSERNSLYHAARKGVSVDCCDMYMLGLPCVDCARAIIQCGIKAIYVDWHNQQRWQTDRYRDEFQKSIDMLQECGVSIYWWEEGEVWTYAAYGWGHHTESR